MNSFVFIIVFVFFGLNIHAQQNDTSFSKQELFDSLLVEGVREFDIPFKQRNYSKAINVLEEAVQIKPENANAHYYLGYAYSGLNAQYAKKLPLRNKELCIKASFEMQKVIKLDSTYAPKLILSPYSKITSEWGSLALMYLYNDDLDSMKWAFEKGKKQGGFSNFMIAFHRLLLNQCEKDAILFSYGDDSYWNLMYVQYYENYRSDVAVIDLGLLNTQWYQQLINNQKVLEFTQSPKAENNYYLVPFKDSIINIPIVKSSEAFLWNFKAHGSNPFYLYYGDVAMKNILIENQFRRNIYFTKGVAESSLYNMKSQFENQILLNWLNPLGKSEMGQKEFNQFAQTSLHLAPLCNQNSVEERQFLDNQRLAIASRIYYDWSSENNKENAHLLMRLLGEIAPAKKYPYKAENKIIMNQFRRVIMEDY
ncbi:MAG: tetratricopeptide repeat protein [Bacteroidales bacterium]|nr:tetratricopeptide repeat protein [Bacteroidales bacterium]